MEGRADYTARDPAARAPAGRRRPGLPRVMGRESPFDARGVDMQMRMFIICSKSSISFRVNRCDSLPFPPY